MAAKNKSNKHYAWLLLAVAIVCLAHTHLRSQKTANADIAQLSDVDSLEYVITSGEQPEQIITYKGMIVSFNKQLHIPNWVAWELTRDEAEGEEPRANAFAPDLSVDGCATLADYKGSGYDRGHMAPAGDMKWDAEAMQESFYLTNMCPQAKSLNSGSWKKLEEKCRIWAMADSAIVIVCGPVLTDAPVEYIGESRVAVPKRFFKVILSPYANPPRGIGFVMPNSTVPGGMQACAMSIDEVETITGYDFFASLPDEVEKEVESQNKFHYWSTIR
jgi:endonuclease G